MNVTDLRVASRTDRGRVRDQNEDAVLADLPLVAVADGMGGHKAGEVASNLALEILEGWKERLEGKHGLDAAEALKEAFAEANRVVYERSHADEETSGMGTTLTAAWLEADRAALAHVGDSRAYLLRGGKLEKLTEDQNVAQRLVRQGKLSEDEAASSPQRHVVLQAIGTEPAVDDIEVIAVDLRPGDRLLLSSDGLHGVLGDDDRIRAILEAHHDPDEACRELVDAANSAGGQDNISVIVVDAGEPSTGGEDAPVVVARPAAEAPRRSLRRGRLALIAASLLGALTILGLMAWMSVRPSFVLSSRGGMVVVLDGRPGSDGGPARGDVVRVFEDEPVERFSRPARQQLRRGIPVESMADAEGRVANLPRLLGASETPTPDPGVPPEEPATAASPPPSPVPPGAP